MELLVSEGIILVSTKQLTWQNAMELSCQPLLKEQVINQNYQTILMSQMADEEAYYFLNNRIAIPHSSPENGVIKGGCSLLYQLIQLFFLEIGLSILFPFCNWKEGKLFTCD